MTMHLMPVYYNNNNSKKRKQAFKKPGWQKAQAEHDAWLMKRGVHPSQLKNKTKNEITIKIENNSITSSLKTILNNFDIEDLFINEPPIDEVIGKVLIKKDYDI